MTSTIMATCIDLLCVLIIQIMTLYFFNFVLNFLFSSRKEILQEYFPYVVEPLSLISFYLFFFYCVILVVLNPIGLYLFSLGNALILSAYILMVFYILILFYNFLLSFFRFKSFDNVAISVGLYIFVVSTVFCFYNFLFVFLIR